MTDAMTSGDYKRLADELDAATAKVNLFPERRCGGLPDGDLGRVFMDFLVVRNLANEAAKVLRAASVKAGEVVAEGEPDFAASIAKVIKEESESEAACGWKSCSGCHETNEGAETGWYPYSKMFGCFVGSGCSECGGLGVVWEYWSKDALDQMSADDDSINSIQLEWRDGPPPKPWSEEWFIAETTFRDRVVLRALPDDYTYDFKTADETYIKADKIKRWMQFPDSQYIAAPTASVGAMREALERAIGHIEHMAAWISTIHIHRAAGRATYSFESLGEDMPGMKAALAAANQSDGGDLDARFRRLEAEATDLGYVLAPEPEHPDSPHAPQAVEAVSVDEVAAERERCAGIVQMARSGDIDTDFRSIIHFIEGGLSVERIKEFCT